MTPYTTCQIITSAVVYHIKYSLGGAEELPYFRHPKSLAKFDPYIGPETVAIHTADIMFFVQG